MTIVLIIALVLMSGLILRAVHLGFEQRRRIEELETELEDRNEDLRSCQDENAELSRAIDIACHERDDALYHLDRTLTKQTKKTNSPERVMTEIGRDGLYYVFYFDPPEISDPTLLAENEDECLDKNEAATGLKVVT